jgi:BirA family biotin operon repressor/biotin-[acetyl-CoA-carboxylase] ligase
MTDISGNKLKILTALSAGDFISGQLLGEQLGISRAAVAKHIQSLSELGLEIYKVTNKGYKLAQPLNLLNKATLQMAYNELTEQQGQAQFEVHATIDSTNSELMRRIGSVDLTSGTVVVAEAQTAGRGRRGRQWQSPFGANLYFSYYWLLQDGLARAMGVSIAVGLAVYDCLRIVGMKNVALKWPNDILADGAKLAGILVELDGQPEGPCHLVIGIGLNLAMPSAVSELIDQTWTDLKSQQINIEKNLLVATLTVCLEKRLAHYAKSGLSNMYKEWNELNAFKDQLISLNTGERAWQGKCVGIDEQGGICLRQDGEVKSYYGGEISLRKVQP